MTHEQPKVTVTGAKKKNTHPQINAWVTWKNSDEGKSCLTGTARGEYLENRLWAAFVSGWNEAAGRVRDSLDKSEPPR